ncbi:MAG: hypothetical protein KKA65_06035 [Nanoarchaeota archaeon]|nr:hypothetical protein [Nanoarchaeota archaeon]
MEVNFTDINTTDWTQGDYVMKAYISEDKQDSRFESLIFKNIMITSSTVNYMCNISTEYFNVTIYHPFNDTISYNVSLNVPSGWSSLGMQKINATTPGNYTLAFNITSDQTPINATIYAFVNYTYPNINKIKNHSSEIETSNTIPILEVIRETPTVVDNNKEFYSRLVVHNKGCGEASSVSFVEQISTGWTAYSQTMDTSSVGTTDIPNRQIRFDSNDFSTIVVGGYKVISYKILSPSSYAGSGTLRYNLTWGTRNLYEEKAFDIYTINYTNESRLSFNIESIGSWKARSAIPNETQRFNFTVTNNGDKDISSGEWNVSLYIASGCNGSNYSGSWDQFTREITWPLGALNSSKTKGFGINITCPQAGGYILIGSGTNDTRTERSLMNDTNALTCTGSSCSNSYIYTLSKPSDIRYEKLKQIDLLIHYNWSGTGLTIGESTINFTDDNNQAYPIWQEYSFINTDNTIWTNYTIDSSLRPNFVSASRNITLGSYVDATYGENSNLSITTLAYTWDEGTLFNDDNSIFISIQPYVFVPDAPLLQSPPNASTQVSSPIVLSWFPSTGATSYYVYGDTANGTTFLGRVNVTNYLWSDLESATYKWNVKASTGTQNSTLSDTWQFDLDLCAQDPGYAYALNFPMEYDNTTDTITIIGNTTYGTPSNPIEFYEIYLFARGARGVCAVTNPASGNYIIKSRLAIGNGTFPVTVESKGESLAFSSANMPQLIVNQSGRIILGGVADNIPQEGVSIKFQSNQSNDILLDVSGGEIAFYDSYVADVGNEWGRFIYRGACGSDEGYSEVNTSLTIKKTIFDRATRGQFIYTSNVTIDDMKINRINSTAASGYGIIAGCNMPILNNLQIYHQEQNGGAVQTTSDMPNNTDTIITNSIFDYNGKDIIATANGRGVQLINTQWDRTYDWNFGGGNGTGAVTIKEAYGFLPTFTDASGNLLANVSIVALDNFGDSQFNLLSNSIGLISEQYMPTWQVEKSESGEAITSFNPYTVKIKKYGKTFVSEAKSFAARTVETKQLTNNPFTNRSESSALNLGGVNYIAPYTVSYGDEINTTWNGFGQINNHPVTQSEFFAIFANGIKLVETTNYTINYGTGAIIFVQDMTGYEMKPVYSYGGNITLTNGATSCLSMNDIYDYMQANLSEVVTTVDGNAYTLYVDLIIGNDTARGCIYDPTSSITFEDGYIYSFSTAGGYIDLAGITAGSGSGGSGGLPLNIYDDVGSSYSPGDRVDIFSTTLDSSGALVSSIVNITVYYPNNSIISQGQSTEQSTGRFKYNFTLPSSAPEGTYLVDIDATYSGNEVHDNLAFMVSIGGGGSANPEVIVTGPSVININTFFDIAALTLSSSGVPVNCNSTPQVTIRDTLAGANAVSSAPMTNFGTGQYNYTWSTPNQSTYLAIVVCTISGADYSGITEFSTQNVPGGGTPKIEITAPSIINTNTNFAVSALVKDSNNLLTNCTGNLRLTIKDSLDNSIIHYGVPMTLTETGKYNFTTSLSYQSTFIATANCTMGSNEYISNIITISSQNVPGGSGSAYPTITMEAATPIAILTDAAIVALVRSSDGTITDCDGTLGITIKDLMSSYTHSGNMTNIGTGMYNYTWTTPASASVYYVNSSCSISSTSYTGFTLVSTQSTGAVATVDYEQIAVFVWNYTSRNLTYYNQSVAESLQACLQDGDCADWWINTTFSNINNLLNIINSTTNNIYTNTLSILDYFNCTNVTNDICTMLTNIQNNVTDIQARTLSLNTTQIPALQTDITNIYTDTQSIRINISGLENITEILNKLYDIDYNLTYILNNMFYQGNATGAFLVDYVATAYTEPGYSAELWVLTRDLLGNEKTVSSAECNIIQSNSSIYNATTTISSGGVYAVWSTSLNQSSGTYYWNCSLTNESTINLHVPFFISLTDAGLTNQTLSQMFNVRISDFGEIAQGAQYRIKAWITDYLGRPKDADSAPIVTLYDPNRNLMLNVTMTWEETGIYAYNFTTTSSQTDGIWETVVTTIVNGITNKQSDYWELESSPAEVTIIGISDKVIPGITADVRITNEGTADYEYHYEYCIVDTQNNECGGIDDICYGMGAKWINITKSWVTQFTCDNNGFVAGTNYWFKVVVFWGTEKSGATQLFTAEAAAEPTPTPTPSPGGGAGGGAPSVTPSPVVKEEKPIIIGDRILPPIIATVPPPYKTVAIGGLAAVEITIPGLKVKLENAIVKILILTLDEKLMASKYDVTDLVPGRKITKKIMVPEAAQPGEYIVRAEVTYEEQKESDDDYINVVTKEEAEELIIYISNFYKRIIYIISSLILLLLLIIFLLKRRKRQRDDEDYCKEFRGYRRFIPRKIDGRLEKIKHDLKYLSKLYDNHTISDKSFRNGRKKLIKKMTLLNMKNRIKHEKRGGDLNKIVEHMERHIKK